MKKWILLISLIFIAACTSKPKDTRVTLTYFTMETLPEQRQALEEMVKSFEALHPNIHVRVDGSTAGFQKLAIRIAGGDAPDVFYFVSDRLPALIHRDVVLDLNRFLDQDSSVRLADYYPETVQSGTLDGKLYLFPFHFSTDLLVYNKDSFDQAGLKYPNEKWNWNDFLEAAQKLTVREEGKVVRYGTLQPRTLFMIRSFGGDCFDSDLKSVQIDSAATRQALQFLIDLNSKHGVAPSQMQIKDVEKDDGLDLFSAGKVGMFIGRTFMMPSLAQIKNFSWDVAYVPRGAIRYSRLAVGGNCIYKHTRHPQEAWEFVKFFSGPEGSKICGVSRNCVPALKSMAASPIFATAPPAHVQVMIESIAFSKNESYGLITWDEFFQKSLKVKTEKILFDNAPVDQTLKEITEAGRETLKEEAHLRGQ